ncbi:MAG: hypothetical protein VX938_05460, partial [Myxococcota bacterium]|nr:hypothetical protein [Myxococcota bacterium]
MKRLLGRLTEDNDQPERAITFWQGILRERPGDTEADETLGRLYPIVGKWHAMVELLKNRLKTIAEEDRETRLALHKEMIDIYDRHLNAPSKVVGVWQAILEMDPGNQEALSALLSQYETMNRWPDLVKILQQMVRHEEDPQLRIALHRRIASIMMERFSNAAEAIRQHEAILELDPQDRDAITVLKEIYEQRRDWERFVEVSEQELSLLEDPDEIQGRLRELAKTASERIRKPGTPMSLWERVLDANPADPEALEQLELLCERDRDFPRLAEVLMQRIEVLDEPEERMGALEKLATIYVSRLDLNHEATEIWARVLEIDPSHRKAQAEMKRTMLAQKDWDGLETFFQSYGNPAEWVRTLESQARAAETPEERLGLLRRAALLWKEELDDERRAVKNLELVQEEAPGDLESAAALIPLYRSLKAWKKLPGVYTINLDHTDDADRRRELLMELSSVQDHHLGDTGAALESWLQALREGPASVGLSQDLKDLAERSGGWAPYVDALTDVMDQLPDEESRLEALLEVGRAALGALNDPETALSSYLRVLDLDRGHSEALDALEAIHRRREDWSSLVEVLERRLRVTTAPNTRLELLAQLGEAWEGPLNDLSQATRIYRSIVEEAPENLLAHDALLRLLTQQGEHA